MTRTDPLSDTGWNSDSLDVGNDIGSRIEQIKVEYPIDLNDDNVPSILYGTVSSERRQCRQIAAAMRKAPELSRRDGSVQRQTIGKDVTGGVDGKAGFAALLSLDGRLELGVKAVDEFHHALKAGDLHEVMVLRHELELCSSSLIDEVVA